MMRICATALALLWLALATAAAAMEVGTDRPGMDYRSFAQEPADPALCEARCQAEARCRAWTYVKPGVQGPQARCWLKHAVPQAVARDCCVSGVKVAGATVPPASAPAQANSPADGAWLGVQVTTLRAESASARGYADTRGALVLYVLPNSPAALAGIRPSDIIVAIGGQPVATHRDLVAFARSSRGGSRIRARLWRPNAFRTVEVVLGDKAGLQAWRAAAPSNEQLAVDFDSAKAVEQAGRYAEAAADYRRLADRGLISATLHLGWLYEQGLGVARNAGLAARLYRLAAEQGHTGAAYHLASLYDRGLGLPRDDARAYYWYDQAANKNVEQAVAPRTAVAARMTPAMRAQAQAWAEGKVDAAAAPPPTPPPATAAPDRPLSRAAVTEAQRLLARFGYDPGPADGSPGPRTRRAVRGFQRDHGIAVDGALTASLLDRLRQRATAPAPQATTAPPAPGPTGPTVEGLSDLDKF